MPGSLVTIVDRLEAQYGAPAPPITTDAFELILWENVAYLASDARRTTAFRALQNSIGTRPDQILAADRRSLSAICQAGILPKQSVEKLITVATIARDQFGGDLSSALGKGVAEARKALTRFPGIGIPAADKILLFTRSHPSLPLDSNGLRVLSRIGFGESNRSYSETYRTIQAALATELPSGYEYLIKAHQLLRQHGQSLCKRSHPRCGICPLIDVCEYGRASRSTATVSTAQPANRNR